jgi:hypothetical protein
MVGSEEKRRLIDAYGESFHDRRPVAKSVAGLLIVAFIAVVGASYGERDQTNSGATPDAKVSGKQVVTGR